LPAATIDLAMSMLTATLLGQSFGDFDVFRGVSLAVPGDGRIGLVGPNGVGKTTLLMVLAGLATPSAGTIHRARGTRIGYLPQEAAEAFAGHASSVYSEMLAVFADLRADEARLRELEAALGEGDDPERVARYGRLQERFEQAGGYAYPTRIQQVLTGLGFGPDRWDTPIAHLSGGQKTRALLARLLLEKPDLLILDEPTNHLDIEAVAWLEGALAAWDGALLVVSHDRYFLDRVVNTVWEMSPAGIEAYRGNYSAHVRQRHDRWERRRKAFEAMKARFEKELDFVRRNIAGQRTQMAQGKLARLSREVEAVHAGGLEVLDAIRGKGWMQATAELDMERPSDNVQHVAGRIAALREPAGTPPELHLRLRADTRGGDIALRTAGLVVGYPGTPLFDADDILLMRGGRAALIGGNGTGKTTFLRTVLGQLPPLAGEVKLGGGIEVGYFAQSQDDLEPGDTVLDALLRRCGKLPGEARGYLARFLFRGEDADKRVSMLSGGERGRLALAILALGGANLLLLDEPTNHLDIPSQEILEAILAGFDGTVLLVSHDRYLVDRLATQVWELEGGRLRVYTEGYQAYLAARRAEAEPAVRAQSGAQGRADGSGRAATGTDGSTESVPAPAFADGKSRLSKNELTRRAAAAERLEARIGELEGQLTALSADLQAAGESGAFETIRRLSAAHAETEAEIGRLYGEWDAVMAELAGHGASEGR